MLNAFKEQNLFIWLQFWLLSDKTFCWVERWRKIQHTDQSLYPHNINGSSIHFYTYLAENIEIVSQVISPEQD